MHSANTIAFSSLIRRWNVVFVIENIDWTKPNEYILLMRMPNEQIFWFRLDAARCRCGNACVPHAFRRQPHEHPYACRYVCDATAPRLCAVCTERKRRIAEESRTHKHNHSAGRPSNTVCASEITQSHVQNYCTHTGTRRNQRSKKPTTTKLNKLNLISSTCRKSIKCRHLYVWKHWQILLYTTLLSRHLCFIPVLLLLPPAAPITFFSMFFLDTTCVLVHFEKSMFVQKGQTVAAS